MKRRYTIHRDGDLLVEELDAAGRAIEPEPVPESDRLPFELILSGPDGKLHTPKLIELLEAALDIEQGVDEDWKPKHTGSGQKLPVIK